MCLVIPLIYIVTSITILFSTIFLYFKFKYTTWKSQNIPYLQPVFPYGNTKSFALQTECFGDSIKRCYDELKQKTSTFGGFYTFSKPFIMLLDPELIKSVFVKDFVHFGDRRGFADEKVDPLTGHLVFLRGQKWKNARTKLTPIFTSGKLKKMFEIMLETSKELGNIIDQHKNTPVDSKDIFARQTTDTIGSCAFGLKCNSLKDPNTEFRKYGSKIFELDTRNTVINTIVRSYPMLLKYLKIPKVNPEITNFFMDIVKQTVDYREKNNIQRKDFLDFMIRLKNKQNITKETEESKENEGFTFNEIVAHLFAFFAGGFETTTSTLNFCFFELSINPYVQEKVRNEVLHITKDLNGILTYEGIMEMKYMDKVIQEVLRKYPSIPVLQRDCTEVYQIPNSEYTVKKGSAVFISTLGLHRDPDYYPDPDKFDPERFNEEEKAKRHPYTYLPFGEGPRNCIGNHFIMEPTNNLIYFLRGNTKGGMRFAWLQMKIVLSVLLMDFKFILDPKTVTPIVFDPKNNFLSPKHTVWLRAERIKK